MKLLWEGLGVVASILAIFNYVYSRLFVKPKKLSNVEHVKQLEQENREIDEMTKNINKRRVL